MEFKRLEVSHSTALMRVVRSAICYLGLHTISKAVCVWVEWTHTYTIKISPWHAQLLSEAWKYTPWHPMIALFGRVPQKLEDDGEVQASSKAEHQHSSELMFSTRIVSAVSRLEWLEFEMVSIFDEKPLT